MCDLSPKNKQSGVIILEALIAILIFSMGILAIIGLQAAAIGMSTDAKYRTEASLLANQLIGNMWVGDRTPATLQTNFSSPSGAGYLAWLPSLSALPNASTIVTITTINPVAPATSTTNLVTVTIRWKAPNEPAANPLHQYTAVAQII